MGSKYRNRLNNTRKHKPSSLTIDIREQWAKERKYIGIDFLGQCYAIVPPLVHFAKNSTYYLWDVLTAAFVGKADQQKYKRSIVAFIHTGQAKGVQWKLMMGGRYMLFMM